MAESPMEMLRKAKQKAIHGNLKKWTASTRINVGMSTCEIAAGSKIVLDTLTEEIKKNKIRDVHIGQKGCVGRCHLEPTVEVFQMGLPPFKYENVDAEKAKKIVQDHLIKVKKPPAKESLLQWDYTSKDALIDKSNYIFGDIDYFKKQRRIVLRNCGVIDPESIDDYLSVRGYEALAKVLGQYTPGQVIDDVTKSGLRGRGGGGFPTGLKWRFTADQKSEEKYVICNADEGDPGAFMDRSTIEGDPFSVLEAMTIGAYAIGANKGIVYIRAEYPLAVQRLKIAIKQAEELNLLGANIFGTKFSFSIELVLGAGAFVCGEETALINSIQGERGMPRIRPPYPSVKGVWGKPTVINNVETWANIAPIILDGYQAFAAIGTEKSRGTKVFALAGKVKNTGLVEVPMGTTLGEVIFDIGGGIKNDLKYKAAQTGGPSGGCLPVQYLNTPIDYDSLQAAGSIMGSGGLIVMDETDCMVDVARFFLEFTQDESCGKCTPCREGTKRMLEILNRITSGKGVPEDIAMLKELGETIKKTALCGLGQTAPNPVLSTLRYFPQEYDAHIFERKCLAVVCSDLFVASCQHACPVNVDIPGYIGLIHDGKVKESLELIMDRNPFPSVCGRVCNHPCESNCRRSKLDEAVSIMKLKAYAAEHGAEYEVALKTFEGEKRQEKIAVIGSGPAGLSCAYQCAKRGYQVTVFESEKSVGGMLTLGIPSYRLPREYINEDIKRIRDVGVKIQTGVTVGKEVSLSELKKQGYSAIFIAIGSWKERMLSIAGEKLKGVLSSLEFLKKVNTKSAVKSEITGKTVAVVGGGNAAVDAARTALRLGAEKVSMIYRRTKDDMPAFFEEIEQAEAEGITLHTLLNPVEIQGKNGKVAAVVCASMRLGEFDLSGRKKAVASEEKVVIPADVVIMAVGAEPNTSSLVTKEISLALHKNGTIVVDPITLATSIQGIFAGGDTISGGATVIQAIAEGERAAISIDRSIRGQDLYLDRYVRAGVRKPVDYIDPSAEVETQYRPARTVLPVGKAVATFDEFERVYSKKDALFEATRCLRCDKIVCE
ncbi:MAG: FAD-dependent oxidoreductase [Chitinivibrionales bacterium]|nr:FAD-dependent oxidoreductase [Chitinivibrionales bacterium]